MRIVLAIGLFSYALCSATYAQNPFVNLGPTADFALDQPFVSFTMSNGSSLDANASLGPNSSVQTFLLDTGANSVVAVGGAAKDLHRSGGNFNTGVFRELGVGGFINYFVSEPYTMHVTGVNSLSIDNIKILSDPDQSFGEEAAGFYGIVGMPAMIDRVTTLGYTSEAGGNVDWNDLDSIIDFMTQGGSSVGVEFGHQLPASQGHRYGVPVTALHFDPHGDATPTASPLPFLEVSHRVGCETSTGNYVFDTGAQLSIMSMEKLAELGLTEEDAFTFYDIQGVGGTRKVPGFIIDEYRIETNEGIDLVWRDEDAESPGLQVIGLDLDPSLDGVIGSDLLTGGLLNLGEVDPSDIFGSLLNIESQASIEAVQMDFRELENANKSGTGTIYFDLAANVDQPLENDILAADANGDGLVDTRDYEAWFANNGQDNTRCGQGDFNGDGRTNSADLAIWTAQSSIGPPNLDLACDFDADNACDVSDINLLLSAVGTEADQFDVNASGGPIDLADRDAWLSVAGLENQGAAYLAGDVNLDGLVDPQDLNALGQYWTQTGNLGYNQGDVDGDGFVGPQDLNVVGQNWLQSSSPSNAPVPEPASSWLLLTGGLLTIVRRR